MSKKFSAARRAAFLKAVAETGNQTLAAERAKVSRSWVTLHRSTDPAFDAAVREAVAQAQCVLRDDDRVNHAPHGSGSPGGRSDPIISTSSAAPQDERSKKKGKRPLYHQGHELIIRGTRSGSVGASRRLVQIGRARVKQWTARSEQRFLEVLAETANVKAACAVVGLSPASVYNHRDRRPDFARRWHETRSIAHVRIEMAYLEQAAAMLTEGGVPCDGPIREMNASEALYLIEMNKRREAGERNRPGRWRRKQPPIEEVIERIIQRAATIRAARDLPERRAG